MFVGSFTNYIANAGTPFLWAGCLMLVFGNYGIAYFEAWILRKRYGVAKEWALGWLVAANYLTGGIAFLASPWYLGFWKSLNGPPIHRELLIVFLAWLTTFLFTVVVESCFLLRVRSQGEASKPIPALRASLVLNAASYLLLIVPSVLVSNYQGPLRLQNVGTYERFTRTPPAMTLYWIAPDGMSLRTADVGLQEKTLRPLRERIDSSRFDALVVAKSPTGRLHLKWSDYPISTAPTLILDFEPGGVVEHVDPMEQGWDYPRTGLSSSRRFQKEADLHLVNISWPGYDFMVRDAAGRDVADLGFESPFLNWSWSNQILVPGKWCTAELAGSIYLIDLTNFEVARLYDGFGSMVILRDPIQQGDEGSGGDARR